jgi:hypothetical protein
MFFGTFGQYWFAIGNNKKSQFFYLFKIGYAFSILSFLFYFIIHKVTFLILGYFFISVAHAFLAGKLLSQVDFKCLSLINFLPALLKIMLLCIIPKGYLNSSSIILILSASFLLTHIIYSFIHESEELNKREFKNTSPILASLILSLSNHFFPISDLLWANFFRAPHILNIMAPVSLLTRAVFFFQLIIAQWWLPRFIKKKWNQTPLIIVLILIGVITGSYFTSLIFEFFLNDFLNWKELPSKTSFFLGCLNAVFMALNFQVLQLTLLNNLVKKAAGLLLLVLIIWSLLGFISARAEIYFFIMAMTNATTFIIGIGIKKRILSD